MHRPLLLDITFLSMHPSDILIQGKHQPAWLPVCDHYARSEKRIRTSPVSDLRLHIPIETHVAVHEIRDVPVPGEVDCLPLGLVHSGPARGDAIHVSLIRIPVQLRFALAAHAKMKIAAPCRALCEIASHNEPTDRCVTLAIASHVIRLSKTIAALWIGLRMTPPGTRVELHWHTCRFRHGLPVLLCLLQNRCAAPMAGAVMPC